MDKSEYLNLNRIIQQIWQALSNMLDRIGYRNWQVVRANQPTIQALQNETVYFDIVSRRRYGTQGTKPVKRKYYGKDEWFMESVWFEEILVQVSAFKQRNPEEDWLNTITGSDIIELLQGLINANNDLGEKNVLGVNERPSFFQDNAIKVIRSTQMREVEFETDSGLKDKFPQFDFLLVVEQRLLKNMEKIDTIELETKRI